MDNGQIMGHNFFFWKTNGHFVGGDKKFFWQKNCHHHQIESKEKKKRKKNANIKEIMMKRMAEFFFGIKKKEN